MVVGVMVRGREVAFDGGGEEAGGGTGAGGVFAAGGEGGGAVEVEEVAGCGHGGDKGEATEAEREREREPGGRFSERGLKYRRVLVVTVGVFTTTIFKV